MTHQKPPFFLFGMGCRNKFFYKNKKLYSFDGTEVLDFSDASEDDIIPAEYTVCLSKADGEKVLLYEDEKGVFCEKDGERICLASGDINLPSFTGHPYCDELRILLHEVLYNITPDGKPLPNIFVYEKPWYRDSALIAMVLEKTGNLDLIRDFILSLESLYDRNNAGCEEPDNLGEALYLISCVSDASHPLVSALVKEAKRLWTKDGMPGVIDFSEHPVYSAKWLKYGLSRLELDHSWVEIPALPDSYSSLFWMDYRDSHVEIAHREYDALYPYLWWAEQHFYGADVPDSYLTGYPMTNETYASQANYEGIRVLSDDYAEQRNASPHTWHAAEMFLYLYGKSERTV